MRVRIAQQIRKHYGEEYEPEDITDCDGCRAEGGRLFAGSKNCHARKCVRPKGIEDCAHCDEYACEKLEELFATDPDARERLDEIRSELKFCMYWDGFIMRSNEGVLRFFLTVSIAAVLSLNALAGMVYVDGRSGSDENPGTRERPIRTVGRAAEMVNNSTEPGPTTVKMAPGIYNLTESVEFGGKQPYTETERLVIEADILPDEPQWRPALMPVILSTEDPRKQGDLGKLTATEGLKIRVSHVTIRGLKFLGNPLSRNWHNCVSRIGDDLDDLIVTQCMFVGDRDVIDIYCAVLATGDRFVVDHCIFRNCHACAVLWDGPQGIAGESCSMRYCIVDGAYIASVWTCQTAEDFEFHHNIVTRCEYFWMRKRVDNPRKYRVHDCIVAGNENYSGYGVQSGPTGRTGPEITYDERNLVRQGAIVLEEDKRARNYLHVVEGAFGSDLGAGILTK